MTQALLKIMVNAQIFVRSERGQTAMEWLGIAVGLIVAVAVLFVIFGDTLKREGCDVIESIFGSRPGGC